MRSLPVVDVAVVSFLASLAFTNLWTGMSFLVCWCIIRVLAAGFDAVRAKEKEAKKVAK
jgi:hypothetical protein